MNSGGDGGTLGCTVGVVRLAGGFLFFKNRDLSGRYVTRHTSIVESSADTHALRGVDLETGQPAGVSVGVNRHRVCVANTHIVTSTDVTYDLLCERLLAEVRQHDDVAGVVGAFMAGKRLQGGRILIAAPAWACLVEVLRDQWQIEPVAGNFVVTNEYSLLPFRADRTAVRDESSRIRLKTAGEAITAVSSVRTLKSLLRSHIPTKGEFSICNHRDDGGGTESSHIVQVYGESVTWWSLAGFPCENDYAPLVLFQ